MAQNKLEQFFLEEKNFYSIEKKVDAYFKEKHPNKSPYELSTGPHRDGKYVKYMRWKSFWKHHIDEKGNFTDFTAHRPNRDTKNLGLYAQIPWTNISNTNYITGQISLGRTTSLAFHPSNPNIFFVGAAIGGIWKTTDGGQYFYIRH